MNKKGLLTLLPAFLLTSTLLGCNNNTCTVTFETLGGTKVESVKVKNGNKITRPTIIPTKEKHHFSDWCLDSDETASAFNFNSPITKDTTIYAKYFTHDAEVSKTEWENLLGQFKFDNKSSFTMTLKKGEGTPNTYVIKKDEGKLTFKVNDTTAVPYYIDANGVLWGEKENAGTYEYSTSLEYIGDIKNSFQEGANSYDKAFFNPGNSRYYAPLNSFYNFSVSFKDVDSKKAIDTIAGYTLESYSFTKPTLEDVFHTISKDNRYTKFNHTDKSNTWSIDKAFSKINKNTTQYFVIKLNEDVKKTSYLDIKIGDKSITEYEGDVGLQVYANNANLNPILKDKKVVFTNNLLFGNSTFVLEFHVGDKDLNNINIVLTTTNDTPNDTNEMDEDAFIKFLDDETLYNLGLAKISSTEADACARQPETAGKIHIFAGNGRRAIIDNKVSGLQAYSIGKAISSGCDAMARQPEMAYKLIEQGIKRADNIVKNDKEVAIGFGKVYSSGFDAMARQPETYVTLDYILDTLYLPCNAICGNFNKALAIGKSGGSILDAMARQPESIGTLYHSAKLAVEDILNS